jgi:hypothetical protein
VVVAVQQQHVHDRVRCLQRYGIRHRLLGCEPDRHPRVKGNVAAHSAGVQQRQRWAVRAWQRMQRVELSDAGVSTRDHVCPCCSAFYPAPMGCIRACRRGCRGGRNTLSVLPLLRDPDTAALTDFAQRQIVRLGRRSPCRRVCRRWAPASEHERASANRLHPRGRLVFDALRPRLGRLLGHARRPSRHRQPEHVAIPQWCRAFLPVSALGLFSPFIHLKND